MHIRTIQWNIGGGRIRDKSSVATNSKSYDREDLDYVVEVLRKYQPDIITLQEVHDGNQNQAEYIAKALGLEYFVLDSYAESHLADNEKLSQAIISRYPIKNHDFRYFLNPGLIIEFRGENFRTHEKGVTKITIETPADSLEVETLHLVPFPKAKINPMDSSLKELRNDIDKKLLPLSPGKSLIQGDFNVDDKSLSSFLPKLFREGVREVPQNQITTPEGQTLDHILYRGLKLVSSDVISDVLTDHFPILSVFESE